MDYDFGDGDISRCRSLMSASHIISSIIVRNYQVSESRILLTTPRSDGMFFVAWCFDITPANV